MARSFGSRTSPFQIKSSAQLEDTIGYSFKDPQITVGCQANQVALSHLFKLKEIQDLPQPRQ